jgi:hypothetical protein
MQVKFAVSVFLDVVEARESRFFVQCADQLARYLVRLAASSITLMAARNEGVRRHSTVPQFESSASVRANIGLTPASREIPCRFVDDRDGIDSEKP